MEKTEPHIEKRIVATLSQQLTEHYSKCLF